MPDGEVGGGHQNDWKPQGTIYEKHPKQNSYPEVFTKGDATETATRNSSECWTAGTPVVWEGDDISNAQTVTAPVGALDDMLVSRDPETQEITEYHPLITFFNEIMARIMRDGHKDWLSNLEKGENAIYLWEYLNKKYLKPSEKAEANGSSKKAEAV